MVVMSASSGITYGYELRMAIGDALKRFLVKGCVLMQTTEDVNCANLLLHWKFKNKAKAG